MLSSTTPHHHSTFKLEKENVLDFGTAKKYKTPGQAAPISHLKAAKPSIFQSKGGTGSVAVKASEKRVKLADVKNGGTPARPLLKSRANPTTTKKTNLRVWKDLDSSTSSPSSPSEAESESVQRLKKAPVVVQIEEAKKETKVPEPEIFEIEYAPPNTLDKFKWRPDPEFDFDVENWDLRLEAPCKPFVPRSTQEIHETIENGSLATVDEELVLLTESDFFPPTHHSLDDDLICSGFDNLAFSDLVSVVDAPKKKKTSMKKTAVKFKPKWK